MRFKVKGHNIVAPGIKVVEEGGFTLGPGETVTKEHIITVPTGSGPPKFDFQLSGDCPCGGKMVKFEVGPRELRFKCSKRWKFWRKHAELGVGFELTKINDEVTKAIEMPKRGKYDVN
jgi:hypothetical protein